MAVLLAAIGFPNEPGWAQSTTAHPEFEVASIKRNTSGSPNMDVSAPPGNRFNAENVPLRFLIRVAYDVKDFQIAGGPAWINSDRYDITAKSESDATFAQMRPMLQSLLADRFKLALHRELKELPVYDLVAAKSGLKLTASKELTCVTPNSPQTPRRPGEKPTVFCGVVQMGKA